MSKAVYQLEPLTCPSCIKKIESLLTKTRGVETVKVLFNSSKVKAEFNGEQVKATQLQEKIQNLGYQVLSIKES